MYACTVCMYACMYVCTVCMYACTVCMYTRRHAPMSSINCIIITGITYSIYCTYCIYVYMYVFTNIIQYPPVYILIHLICLYNIIVNFYNIILLLQHNIYSRSTAAQRYIYNKILNIQDSILCNK